MKKRITAIILTLCFTFILMPFSVVKAKISGGGPIEIRQNSNVIGSYRQYQYYPDDINNEIFTNILFDISTQYSYGILVEIDFNSYCSGTFTIDIANWHYTNLVNIDYDGTLYWTQSTDTLTIKINNTSRIKIYGFIDLIQQNASWMYVNSISVNNLRTDGSLPDKYLTYQIPDDRIMAFNFFLTLGDYIHYDNTNPYPYIRLNNTSTAGFVLNDGDELIFAYFTTMSGPPDRTVKGSFNITTSAPGSYTLTETQLSPIDKYQITGGEGLVCAKLTYSGANSRTLTFRCNSNKRLIRPIYIGKSTSYMSEETRGFLGLDTLVNNPNEDMDDIADDLGDLHDEENDIIGGFESDLNDFNTDMDLDDYDFITDLNDSNTYFKMVLNDVFTNSSSVRAFWVIPLILVIITALLGR